MIKDYTVERVKRNQYLVVVELLSFEKITELISDLMREGYFINEVVYDKTHTDEIGRAHV